MAQCLRHLLIRCRQAGTLGLKRGIIPICLHPCLLQCIRFRICRQRTQSTQYRRAPDACAYPIPDIYPETSIIINDFHYNGSQAGCKALKETREICPYHNRATTSNRRDRMIPCEHRGRAFGIRPRQRDRALGKAHAMQGHKGMHRHRNRSGDRQLLER